MDPLLIGDPALRIGHEIVNVHCTTADAEVSFEQDGWFRKQPRRDVVGKRRWVVGKPQPYRVAAKAHPERQITVSLACDVDARYAM